MHKEKVNVNIIHNVKSDTSNLFKMYLTIVPPSLWTIKVTVYFMFYVTFIIIYFEQIIFY